MVVPHRYCQLSLSTLCYHWQILSNSLFLFSFSEYGVRGRKTDNKAKMKGGLDWIRGLRARSPYNGNHFSCECMYGAYTVYWDVCMCVYVCA